MANDAGNDATRAREVFAQRALANASTKELANVPEHSRRHRQTLMGALLNDNECPRCVWDNRMAERGMEDDE